VAQIELDLYCHLANVKHLAIGSKISSLQTDYHAGSRLVR